MKTTVMLLLTTPLKDQVKQFFIPEFLYNQHESFFLELLTTNFIVEKVNEIINLNNNGKITIEERIERLKKLANAHVTTIEGNKIGLLKLIDQVQKNLLDEQGTEIMECLIGYEASKLDFIILNTLGPKINKNREGEISIKLLKKDDKFFIEMSDTTSNVTTQNPLLPDQSEEVFVNKYDFEIETKYLTSYDDWIEISVAGDSKLNIKLDIKEEYCE